ncbi:metallophosphoesterase [soil metagenome]
MQRMKRALLILLAIAVFLVGLAGWGYRNARADPIVRRATIALPGWPAGAAPVRVALLSDIHMESATMDPARLTRIVGQINALQPDLILIAGDFIEGRGAANAAHFAPLLTAPLSRLRAPLGVVAVLGNHDHWTDAALVRRSLEAIGMTVVANGAVVRGPLVIGGLDDQPTRHANLGATLAAMRPLRGARLILAHSPDIAPSLPADVPMLLAAHTHCGQIVLPFYGPLTEVSNFGARYRCGLVREGRRAVIITAGVGTSTVPMRLGAPADVWLLTLGPRRG